MAIDVKELIEKAVRLISENGDLLKLFQKEPVKAIEKATGLDPVSYTHLTLPTNSRV